MIGRIVRKLGPGFWPLSIRVPVVVALLMMGVSALIGNRVLAGLEETQERHLQQLASAYLDGLSASLIPPVLRDDVWEVFDTLDRAKQRYRALNVKWAAVTNGGANVIAASDPARFPSLQKLPDAIAANFSPVSEVTLDEERESAHLSRALLYQEREIGRIYAEADIGALLHERAGVLRTLLLTNGVLTLFLALAGYLAVRRMLNPVSLLSSHLDQAAQGAIGPIPEPIVARQGREYQRLFKRYNGLVRAVSEREALAADLAEEERLASLGRLASGMAHEINNPLGGMFNALDALRRHGERETVRQTSVSLLERGLSGIRDLVRSTLATYRGARGSRDLARADLDDLRLLLGPELKRRSLTLSWDNRFDESLQLPAGPVRDVALNLLLNACEASPEGAAVTFRAELRDACLVLHVADEGPGLPPDIRDYLIQAQADATPVNRRAGLGLWIVKRLCAEIGAELVLPQTERGSEMRVMIPGRVEALRDVA
ncbi:MAG: HAMP domain-containing histidine kinase [Rhizobiales bacterium]|nr:HAMP domain-containing histidine kinase [Hyphomicrobiales bacterium]